MVRAKNVTAELQEARERQYSVSFCPHEGLTLDLVKGRVIGCKGENTLTRTQKKLLYFLCKRQKDGIQGGWCTWDELEKRLYPKLWKYDIVNGKRKKRRLTRAERLDR